MNHDPRQYAINEHKRWMGYLQPEGVVVSAVALVDHGVQLDASAFSSTQENFLAAISRLPDTGAPFIPQFASFARTFLGWNDKLLDIFAVEAEVPDALRLSTGEFGELLYPSAALRQLAPADPAKPWLLLVRQLPAGTNFDAVPETDRGWQASPAQKFERLLRGVSVPIGIIANGTEIRLIYAPRGENAGSLTFPVRFMTELPGRAVTAALEMLLSHRRLISVAEAARLPSLLKKSREYQSAVSTQLAEQVLEALYELVRGFQAADQQVGGKLLRDVLARNPDEVYHGLLNVLLRLVFLLFTEDRSLMPGSRLYQNNYSVHGLFERLDATYKRYPDTMEYRYGAWAQLLALFRLVHGGCKHPELMTPARSGNLFDFNRFPFLEGRVPALADEPGVIPSGKDRGELTHLPVVSDGTIHGVLKKLLMLNGERLSYRALDVEEIGSVYQTIMGFCVEVSAGNAIALKGKRKNGGVPAAPVINLDHLLAVAAKDRAKWIKENADTDLNGDADKKVKAAATVMDLLAALDKRIDRESTPMAVQPGGLYLQPTDERRRSGSHYTPRSFTRPIVQKTLEPILTRLGRHPKPEEILALKICDIAVGSAAFLVETCRQLADELIAAWHFHKCLPVLPPDEDEVLHAMRTIAQRCLYGVDRNPMAVDLAKLSLWLATLAKDHPFTFVDHAIRCGDSLVGLTRKQIETFSWKSEFTTGQLWEKKVREYTAGALRERQILLGMGDDYGTPALKRAKLEKADELLGYVRFIGDAAICAFFSADKDKAREAKRQEFIERLSDNNFSRRPIAEVKALRGESPSSVGTGEGRTVENSKHPVRPFHWEIEFPEVFDRENPGFDAIVGNPPFVGGKRVSTVNGVVYPDWLSTIHDSSEGGADLVAHFFRRAFALLRREGCFGLIATKTISQGDTRASGLRWICTNGGTIYAARKRDKWPGAAAVTVSVVWTTRADLPGPFELDGRFVPSITAYLFHAGGHDNPAVLQSNADRSFIGSYVLGMGFTFDDTDETGVANPLSLMQELVARDLRNTERIFSYIGGEEVNDSPTHSPHRYIINFFDFPLCRSDLGKTWAEAEERTREQWLRTGIVPLDYPKPVAADWPDLLRVIEERVKPERTRKKTDGTFALREPLPQRWWHYADKRPALYAALRGKNEVLTTVLHSKDLSFVLLPSKVVFSHALGIISLEGFSSFAFLQSRPHEVWSRFFASSLEDRLRYTPSDCFETFPFPAGFETNAALEAAGREYYEFRAALMARQNEGLTKTYNRFHDPEYLNDPDIKRLHELHAAMDAAVLTAYGWPDLPTACDFILDYEDEAEAEESAGRKKKKPWRYRWPDEVRDEVLARLLKLNAKRAEEERIAAGEAVVKSAKPVKKSTTKPFKTGKMQFTLGMGTPGSAERILSSDFRLPASQPLLYTTNLVVALLSEAGGSLAWPRLLDAFILATSPKLIQRLAPADDSARVKAWAARWNETVPEGLLLPSLNQLGAQNLTVSEGNDGPVFHLLDGPRRPATEDVAYDAWLTLRVAAALAPDAVQIPNRAKWTKEADSLVLV